VLELDPDGKWEWWKPRTQVFLTLEEVRARIDEFLKK
jgi:hypothetical protein